MATDTKLSQLIINEMTKAQFDALTTVNEDEIYVLTDAETTVITDTTTIVGDGTSTNPLTITPDVLNRIGEGETANDAITTHLANKNNPHSVTKTQVGLGNVDNTSDMNKPISTATQDALDAIIEDLDAHVDDVNNPHGVTAAQIGLGNVNNTSDADKPVSTATQTALDLKADKSNTYTKDEVDSNIEDALTDYVKFTDYATSDTGGVVKQSTVYGFNVSSTGVPSASTKDLAGYQSGDGNMFIGKTTLENVKNDLVKRGVTANDITLTDTEKAAAQTWLGAASQTTVSDINTRVQTIENKIPAEASSTNQLADKAYVTTTINNLAAFYLTSNAAGDAFATKAALLAGPYYFQGEVRTPSLNDYAIVLSDETKDNTCSRYMYDGAQWDFQYLINETPFTNEQVAALDSNITAEKVASYDEHLADTTNPHSVTKEQVGLGNVNNTSDADKPVSTAQQEAIDAVADALTTHEERVDNPHSVTKEQVGLGNVDNTSDINKPVSTATQTALDLKADKSTTYTKTETDTLLAAKLSSDTAASTYATKTELTTTDTNIRTDFAAADTLLQNQINTNKTDITNNATSITNLYQTKQDNLVMGANIALEKPVSHNLPEGYTEVLALYFNGNQFIDTGLVGTENTSYEITYRVKNSDLVPSPGMVLFGSRESATANNIATIVYAQVTGTTDQYNSVNDFGNYTVTRLSNKTYFADIKYTAYNSKTMRFIRNEYTGQTLEANTVFTGTLTTPTNLYVGNSAAGTFTANVLNYIGYVYSLKIWENNVLVRDMVPCTNIDGILGFYDLVNGSFYQNNGAGSFGALPFEPIISVYDKQDSLRTGENITIVDNVISATDTTYTAGEGIAIKNNKISNTRTTLPWGSITGTLSAQTDLQDVLNLKANKTDIIKDVQNISSSTIYNDVSNLPVLDASLNGTRYVALTNGALPLTIYTWDNPTQTWEKIDTCRGSSLYIDIQTGFIYYYRSSSPYLRLANNNAEWGKVTGTLANQTDLQGALDLKANKTEVPTKTSDLTNDSGYITSSASITGNAATATKLANKRTIALTGDVTGSGTFDGSANLSMSTTVIGNLHNHGVNQIKTQDEGGYNWSAGSVDMITRQSIGSARSNKSFNLPAEQIVIEYSQDGGQTWITYPCTDEEKRGLFTETRQKIFYLGGTADITTKSLDWQLRVTVINGKTLSDRYVTVDGIYMWASTAGNKFYYKLERSLNGTPDTWEEVFDNQQLSGWSGNNIRYIPTQNWGSTSTTNTYSLRMTFFMTELSSGYAASTVSDIRLLGTGYYSGANELVKNDRLFKIDTSLNAEFPANVKATLFDGASSQTKAVEWHQGTENAASYVWFSDSSSTTALGKPVWTTSFKYNPTSDTLTVGNITGNAATATNATNHIKDGTVHVTSADKTAWSGKQDKLTAGTNISITNNVIGLTGTIGDDNLPNRLKGTLPAVSSTTEAKLTGFYGSDSGTPFDDSTKFSIMSTNYDYHISQLAQSYDSRELAYRTGDNEEWSEWRYVAWADEVALKQDKLTAGSGIDITDNTISVTLANVPWGNITGDITKQTDLVGVLNNKQDKLIAGTNMEVSGANISTTATRITIRDWSDL